MAHVRRLTCEGAGRSFAGRPGRCDPVGGRELDLHPLSLEDGLDENQIPKPRTFPGHSFVLVNRYRIDDGTLVISEIAVMLGEKFPVTARSRGWSWLAASTSWSSVGSSGSEPVVVGACQASGRPLSSGRRGGAQGDAEDLARAPQAHAGAPCAGAAADDE